MDNSQSVTVFIEAPTEKKLQDKLLQIKLQTQKHPKIHAIYPRGSKVVAWIDTEFRFLTSTPDATPSKKIKKKRTKKVT